MLAQVEVGPESARRLAVRAPCKNELNGLVLPADLVVVEELGKKALRVMSEPHRGVRSRLGRRARSPTGERLASLGQPRGARGRRALRGADAVFDR